MVLLVGFMEISHTNFTKITWMAERKRFIMHFIILHKINFIVQTSIPTTGDTQEVSILEPIRMLSANWQQHNKDVFYIWAASYAFIINQSDCSIQIIMHRFCRTSNLKICNTRPIGLQLVMAPIEFVRSMLVISILNKFNGNSFNITGVIISKPCLNISEIFSNGM